MEFCAFFSKLAQEQENELHRRHFHSLCRDIDGDGVMDWPEWDELSRNDQKAARYMNIDRFNWPPPESMTNAAKEAAVAEREEKERRQHARAEAAKEKRKPWSTVKKRMIDWSSGWVGLPPEVPDPDKIISYEDWLLLSGQVMAPTQKGSGAEGVQGRLSRSVSTAGGSLQRTTTGGPTGQSTPRTRARALDSMLHTLGMDVVLAPGNLNSLRKELLAVGETSVALVKGKATKGLGRPLGLLHVTLHEARDLPNMEAHGNMHVYTTLDWCHGTANGGADGGVQDPALAAEAVRLTSMIDKGGRFPTWEKEFDEHVAVRGDKGTLSVTVWDKEITDADDLVGQCTIQMGELFSTSPPVSESITRWFRLSGGPDGQEGGEIRLTLNFRARPMKGSEAVEVALAARAKSNHLKAGKAGREQGICNIVRRVKGFGQNSRVSVAEISSRRLSGMLVSSFSISLCGRFSVLLLSESGLIRLPRSGRRFIMMKWQRTNADV